MECFEILSPTSGETCLNACEGMHSVVYVDTSNRTLALNGGLRKNAFSTLLDEYFQYKQADENEFASFFEEILPKDYESDKTNDITGRRHVRGWPYLNEQAVLQSLATQPQGNRGGTYIYTWVEKRLEVVEIYFSAPTFDKMVKDGRTSFVTKTSLIGGILGLFTGFSVLSAIEIVYYLMLLLLRIYKR